MEKIEFSSQVQRLNYLLGMHYLFVPAEIVKKLGGKLNIRLICTVNNSLKYHCGLVGLKDGDAYIAINKKRLLQLGLKEGESAMVSLSPDNSKYGMEMPEELDILLEQDPEGNERFHKLSPGKQRNIIYYVSSVKSQQLRIDRAIFLIENLKKLPPGKERVNEIFMGEKEKG